jgi:ABC-type branched-subunit amino acid transport system permease subunit
VSVAWQFYISTVLIYLGVDVIACWGLNLQFGVAGLVNFAFIVFQAAGAYTAAVLTLGPAKPVRLGGFQQYVGGAHWSAVSRSAGCAATTRPWSCSSSR